MMSGSRADGLSLLPVRYGCLCTQAELARLLALPDK